MWYVKSWLSVYARSVHANEVDQTLEQETDPGAALPGRGRIHEYENPETTLGTSARVVAGPSKVPPPSDRLKESSKFGHLGRAKKRGNVGRIYDWFPDVFNKHRTKRCFADEQLEEPRLFISRVFVCKNMKIES